MIRRKLPIAFLLASIFVFTLGDLTSFTEFLSGWLFVFPFLFLYALPISLASEILTKRLNTKMKRALSSLFIHMGFAGIFYFGDSGFATIACFIAFTFFVLDEITRIFWENSWFQRSLVIASPFLLCLSLVLWITAFIQAIQMN
ncbi:hypothetical protein [Bacillus sp. V33-4]|uniref:hypothetical protein n=1 Tax=Bacillus sp. V33-4 TaxID=2054169 RepID=UPI000C78F54D|nr:hypothetical protein [Bacillus sp. V33-4]PLR84363.1 hypothetical protein CVD23_12085 [Bacillus sp. V33-4]